MKKLALKLDDLSVQSFATTPASRDARGTVRGHLEAETQGWDCSDACTFAETCYSCDTCEETCDGCDTVVAHRRIILY